MSWKIERDPYYSQIAKDFGEDSAREAGYFDDSSKEAFDIVGSLDIMCTPLNFIRDNLAGKKNPVVLLATGSFCPIHDGHISMMESAKDRLELYGYDVVGGFFAPDHDEYIFGKVKDSPLDIHQRIKIIHKRICNSDWLDIDSWAGIFRNEAVNFTEIIHRLELYIEKHLGKKIPVVFVFGGDNWAFAKTFRYKGMYCHVGRPGHQATILPEDNERHFVATGSSDLSSTYLRSNGFTGIKLPSKYIIRLSNNKKEMDVARVIIKYIGDVQIEIQWVEDQQKHFNPTWGKNEVISLDSIVKANHNIEISRLYDYFGIRKLGYTERPGSKSLIHQFNNIPRLNNYVLFDDDIHTGNTINYVKGQLERLGINIVALASFVNSGSDEEIIDARDFIVDDDNCGLVIKDVNGEMSRKPYVYPYVCPYMRASIPNPHEFSKEIIDLNKKFKDNL